MINFIKISDNSYHAIFENGIKLGDLLREVNGFFVFYPDLSRYGYWDAYVLRLISDKLNELNQAWDEYLRENLSNKSDALQDDFDILNNL